MNTISSLETTDLPAAYHIEQRAHAFPWSEKTFASNQGERYLNFQLTQTAKWRRLRLRKWCWMKLHCSILRSILTISVRDWEGRCWNI